MRKNFLVYGTAILALAGIGFVIPAGPAVAQQANEKMEEYIVVGAPIERHRVVGRSSTTGADIEEIELTRQVSYADLDLCKHADVMTMETRIENTAEESCKELSDMFPLNPSNRTEIASCTRKAVDGAKQQLQKAITAANQDSDGDGVINCMDRCPATPANSSVDHSGCTVVAAPKTVELQGVNFEFDSSSLTADSMAALDADAEMMKGQPDLMVEIAGHTDSQGSAEYNQGLSERRAQAVLDYLVSHGVNAENVTARGYGESEPVADNGTEEGRAANRRVELRRK